MHTKNNTHYDFNTISMFMHVVESRSFTKAAAELELTKSTISRKVAELEKYLGVRLLTRSTRNLTLTKEGETYYQSCLQIMEIITQTELEVMASTDLIQGSINMVMPVEVGNGLMGRCIKEFLKLHPKVLINLEMTSRKVDVIAEGVDLLVQVGEIDESSLIARNFYKSKRMLVASPDYLIEHGTPTSVDELIPPHYQIKNSSAVKVANKDILAHLPYRFKVNTIQAVLDATLGGLGLAFLPEFMCHDYVTQGQLIHILPQEYNATVPISFVYPERKLMPKRLRAFIDYTTQRYEKEINNTHNN